MIPTNKNYHHHHHHNSYNNNFSSMMQGNDDNSNQNNNNDVFSTVGPHYHEVEDWCHDVVSLGRDFLFHKDTFKRTITQVSQNYQFPSLALHSFLRNVSLLHVKKTAPYVKKALPKYLEDYKKGVSIWQLSQAANYPPYLFARYIVEAITTLSNNNKKSLTEAMRDPIKQLGNLTVLSQEFLCTEQQQQQQQQQHGNSSGLDFASTATTTTTTRLALEVKEAIELDPMYGPIHDKERHIVGIEYEVVLEQSLLAIDIPFETEAQLRDKGTSRTPDILLSCPLAIQVPYNKKNNHNDNNSNNGQEKEWKVIFWIDSKAMFGDENTHRTAVLQQAESYVHRFGPGLILYWFGHAPIYRLGDAQGDIVILGWEIPRKFMLPTGEIIMNPPPKK